MRIGASIFAAALVVTGAAAVRPGPAVPTVEAPPLGMTGGFGEPTCVQCHTGNDVNDFGGRVRVEGLPEGYRAGEEYVLTVVLQAEETSVAGFQLAVRYADGERRGRSAGRLAAADGRVTVRDSAGVSYVHHTVDGSRPASADGTSWNVVWVAPTTGRPVVIHVAANSGNADNSPLSDLVYTGELVMRPASDGREDRR